MIIIKIMGGLGNQMFQYALYRKLLYLDKNPKMDANFFSRFEVHNGLELENVFNIKIQHAQNEDITKLGDVQFNLIARARRKAGIIKKTHIMPSRYDTARYMPAIFEYDNVYLDGYWQSEKYFADIKDIIKGEFKFGGQLLGRNGEIAQKIEEENSISIHIRRGDYLSIPLYQNICTKEYYKAAIDFINKRIKSPQYYVFSDDINWCRTNLQLHDAIYVDWNRNENSHYDMQLMSKCKHNIIANSSFSWWGAWLNDNPDKIVVAPNKWFNDHKIYQQDIVPDSWIKL